MKKLLPLFLVLLVLTLQAAGQQKQMPEETLLIALKDGSVIYPEAIRPIALPLLKPYLRVNNQYRLPPDEVKYYKDGSSYYYWAEVTESGEGELLKVDAKGKLTTYFRNSATLKPGAPEQPLKPEFFQAGNGPIRKITYHNLNQQLTDNPESMQKLQEVKKLRRASKIALIAGSTLLAAGVVHTHMLNTNNSKPPMIETGLKTRISPLLLLGAATLTIPLANRMPAKNKTREAIALYNK